MAKRVIGVLGATSLVGDCLLGAEAAQNLDADVQFVALSRRRIDPDPTLGQRVTWRCLGEKGLQTDLPAIEEWICLAPVWILPDFLTGGMMDVSEYNKGNGKVKLLFTFREWVKRDYRSELPLRWIGTKIFYTHTTGTWR